MDVGVKIWYQLATYARAIISILHSIPNSIVYPNDRQITDIQTFEMARDPIRRRHQKRMRMQHNRNNIPTTHNPLRLWSMLFIITILCGNCNFLFHAFKGLFCWSVEF